MISYDDIKAGRYSRYCKILVQVLAQSIVTWTMTLHDAVPWQPKFTRWLILKDDGGWPEKLDVFLIVFGRIWQMLSIVKLLNHAILYTYGY